MKRIAVLGSPGSGKSTFSARLGEMLALPVIHLDDLFWETWGNGPDPSPQQIRAKLEEVARLPEWLIDGIHDGQANINGRRTRLEAADSIIYLDMPPLLCVLRLVRRRISMLERANDSLRPNERLTWSMIQAAWQFRSRRLLDEVLEYAELKRVVVLTSPSRVEEFVRNSRFNP